MISIVVPVYKSEKTLQRCVESLQAQTWQKIEIILVDDGSPDGCPVMCDAYAKQDSRIRVIHKKNGGVSSARNAGLLEAEGTCVAFVDSDDYVEPEYCEKMRRSLDERKAQIAICGYNHHYVGACVEKLPGDEKDLLELYKTGFLNMPWNKLFLRQVMTTGNPMLFPEDLDLGEDLLLNLAYLKECEQVALVNDPLYHYIQEESGKTLSSQKRDNKLELSKRIRREAECFFREHRGDQEAPGETEYEKRIRRIVDTRFLCECLDDVERLPFEKELSAVRKRSIIRSFCEDAQVKEACVYAAPAALDYRILQWCMGRSMVWGIYGLSLLRSVLVRLKRKLQ